MSSKDSDTRSKTFSPPETGHAAVALAEKLLRDALATETAAEKARARQVARLITDSRAKALTFAMTDRLIRSENARRAAKGWRNILGRTGIPRGFRPLDRGLVALGAVASRILPGIVMPAIRARLRHDSRGVILPAENLGAHLAQRAKDGMRVNLNQLGEAILGEQEAAHRMDAVLELIQRPDVNYVSVKISAIFSQINVLAWDATLSTVKERLRTLYRAASRHGTFVNLDMEEYRDLALTVAAFREVLDEPEFQKFRAGIVLQAYLPDSVAAQRELTSWAQRRVAAGGAPIKVRIVKGANLAMEHVEAEMHGWNAAPYGSKADTDANFRRMLEFACQPQNAAAVRVGVGSHNLFDVALALVLRESCGTADKVEIEMLEGMANHQARAVKQAAGGLLLYAPIVSEKDFGSALAYLIRRLDENTAPGNFLSDLFSLAPGSHAWEHQRDAFLAGWERRHTLCEDSRRATLPPSNPARFANEPDTDWTQAAARTALQKASGFQPSPLPALATVAHVDAALSEARRAQSAWEALGDAARASVLRRCADVVSRHRFETIALLRDEGNKAAAEADSEISEAIDFARYYAAAGALPAGEHARALGVVVIAPPWNFPFAIPCGGALAALMAGNSVILKPAPEVMRIGWWLAQQLWEAGVPREVLQFLACSDDEAGRSLITDSRTAAVVLTGAFETARMFQSWRPGLRLFAETSGKNSIIVSTLADRDLAVKDLVKSAFGHSGQKCSAASLAILEAEVYDDPAFRRQLCDAAASLAVGPSTEPASIVTPLIREPGEALLRALTRLDPGEEWLLQPRQLAPALWSPGIKLGVKPGSWFHHTECFGPVLGLMRASDLDEASRLQNAVSYGLTAGIHSLDDREIAAWMDRAEAGNLYINRPITGAIVQRQPFGGWKRSCIGPGAKAGGPNYVNLFREWEPCAPATVEAAMASYRAAWSAHFSQEHDPSGLRCESNVFRYRACKGVVLRLPHRDAVAEQLARTAATLAGAPLEISIATEESAESFAARIPGLARHAEFLRTIGPVEDTVLKAAYDASLNWIAAPFAATGRLELTRWLREQSVTRTRHRYGNCEPQDPFEVEPRRRH